MWSRESPFRLLHGRHVATATAGLGGQGALATGVVCVGPTACLLLLLLLLQLLIFNLLQLLGSFDLRLLLALLSHLLSKLPLLLLLRLLVLERVLEEQLRVHGGNGRVKHFWGLGQLRCGLLDVWSLDWLVGHLDFVDAQSCSVVPGFLHIWGSVL